MDSSALSIHPRRRIAAKVRRHRQPVTWLGVTLIAAGAGVVAAPRFAPLLVGAVAGWLLWFAGAAMLLMSLLVASGRSLWAGVLASWVAVAGGAFLFFNPDAGLLATAMLIAAFLILDGASELALALELRPVAVWRWVLASSIASGLAAVVMLAGAGQSKNLTAIFLGLALASTGAALLVLGRQRHLGRTSVLTAQSGGVRTSPRTPST